MARVSLFRALQPESVHCLWIGKVYQLFNVGRILLVMDLGRPTRRCFGKDAITPVIERQAEEGPWELKLTVAFCSVSSGVVPDLTSVTPRGTSQNLATSFIICLQFCDLA